MKGLWIRDRHLEARHLSTTCWVNDSTLSLCCRPVKRLNFHCPYRWCWNIQSIEFSFFTHFIILLTPVFIFNCLSFMVHLFIISSAVKAYEGYCLWICIYCMMPGLFFSFKIRFCHLFFRWDCMFNQSACSLHEHVQVSYQSKVDDIEEVSFEYVCW